MYLSLSLSPQISFNESSLHSTYEYPSESSAWDSDGEDEEEGGVGPEVADDQPSMVGRIHIPRPSFTGTAPNSNGENLRRGSLSQAEMEEKEGGDEGEHVCGRRAALIGRLKRYNFSGSILLIFKPH